MSLNQMSISALSYLLLILCPFYKFAIDVDILNWPILLGKFTAFISNKCIVYSICRQRHIFFCITIWISMEKKYWMNSSLHYVTGLPSNISNHFRWEGRGIPVLGSRQILHSTQHRVSIIMACYYLNPLDD